MSVEGGPEGLDLLRLADWMAREGLGRGAIAEARRLPGGTQNLVVQFRFDGRPFVLRTAALNAHAGGGETMRREARLLAALGKSDVPHPHLIAACADEEVIGRAFYLMELVDGFNVGVGMPALHAGSPDMRRRMGFAMVDALAALARVDHVAVGLGDFGKLDAFLERQAGRWRKLLDSYAKYEGWRGALPGVDAIASWLEAHCPRDFVPGIMHGDFHIRNVLFRNDGPDVAAIIDWELATIGDPLIDLGWMLATWRGPNGALDGTPIIIEPWEGFPNPDELVAYHREALGRNLDRIAWYKTLACYKLAIIYEGTHARACAGKAAQELGERFHRNAQGLIARAERTIAEA